jgi:DNA-binding response OmpR family regulator
MVVDDEAGICKNVEKILKKSNYSVTSASSAKDALAIMAKESFSLLISDIVMPEMNGLELVKMVKKEWPVTKAVMMTAYASTDTAVKAIRIGALDYIPKPFTPDELRATVENALSGKLIEAKISEKEREAINIIDVDIPFDADEVAKHTSEEYARNLGPSDMPMVDLKSIEPVEGFCEVGNMVCDIFKKLGATCKAGVKTTECPQLAKKKKAAKKKGPDTRKLIGIDQPFDYEEVMAVTGPEYIQNLQTDGVVTPYYEKLKADVSQMFEDQVGAPTSEAAITVSTDDGAVEIIASEPVEGFCEVGSMVCDIFIKLGATCKAGVKTAKCPQLAKKKRAAKKKTVDTATLIAPDLPFDYKEVITATGSDYVNNLVYEGVVQLSYETLKENVAKMMAEEPKGAEVHLFPEAATAENILVIDDEVVVNNNLRKILAKKGYDVDQATTKDSALEQINSRPYRLVLLDLRIPGVQGLELLKAIVDKNPETKVIIITGYASIETAVEAARMGAVDYLPKPFTPDEVRNATQRAFQLAA